MKSDNMAMTRKLGRWLLMPLLLLVSGLLSAEMAELGDTAMSDVTGQALFMASKQTNTTSGGVTHTFYRMGFDASLELNANIRELKLGETSTGTDLWIKNLAFGCVANSSNVCVDSDGGTGTKLKPFTLLRPYVQLAIKGDGNRATREVVGVRLGAENASGPMSIGQLISFSGYMNASGNIYMQAQNDVAVTCGPSRVGGCPGTAQTANVIWLYSPTSNGVNVYNYPEPNQALGLKDDYVCSLGLCIAFSRTAVNYGTTARTGLPITASGRRQTQAFIANATLADVVDEVTNTLSLSQPTGVAWLSGALIPLVKNDMRITMKKSLAGSLGVSYTDNTTLHNNLNAYQIPYNLMNVHGLDVNSPLFGLSFQKEAVRYPGYVSDMQKGWSMYLPDAFTLTISQPLTNFVSGIATGAAKEGNIVTLAANAGGAIYDNCWGSAKFC